MKIILASSSPRRIELLAHAGIHALVRKPDADETPNRGEKPKALVRRLSRAKARSVFQLLKEDEKDSIVIAADTIVVAPNGRKILGKPTDKRNAESMLRLLCGHTHTVFTGYCILSKKQVTLRVVTSQVKLRALSKRQIAFYVNTGEPMDKAGSYAAQGKGMTLVESIRGSYTNVVGLPMAQLLADLEEHFDFPFFD
jgi:septum formation protein